MSEERPSWLTEKLVQETLQGTLEDCIVNYAAPPADNYCSDIYRVKCKDRSVIVKIKPQGGIRAVVDNMLMFEKELEMYDFLEEIKTTTQLTFAPRRHRFGDMLVMEDLRTSGYHTENRREQLGLEKSKLALTLLGQLHSASRLLLTPGNYCDLRKEVYYTSRKMKELAQRMYDGFVAEALTWPEVGDFAESLKKYLKVAYIKGEEDTLKAKPLSVMTHGDYHTNNIMFTKSGDVKVVDFQFVKENSPGIDVLYFFETSVRPAVLEENREELISAYLLGFNTTAEKMDLKTLSQEELEADITSLDGYAFHHLAIRTALVLGESSGDVKENSLSKEATDTLFTNSRFKGVAVYHLRQLHNRGLF